MNREASIRRVTRETEITLQLSLDGSGRADIATGIGFLDHMLTLLAGHGLFDLRVVAQGDLQVDDHHTTEDIGICLGQAFDQALARREGIRRYGHFTLPMDEALVTAAVDLGGRYAFEYAAPIASPKLGTFDSELIEHFWQSFAVQAKSNLHVLMHRGRNGHHIAEAVFKSLARALRIACELDPRQTGVASTKGTLTD
jgi:imidazoleglycerol-phosphate dehydratase